MFGLFVLVVCASIVVSTYQEHGFWWAAGMAIALYLAPLGYNIWRQGRHLTLTRLGLCVLGLAVAFVGFKLSSGPGQNSFPAFALGLMLLVAGAGFTIGFGAMWLRGALTKRASHSSIFPLLLLVGLVSSACASAPVQKSEPMCRIAWVSIQTGASGHGKWFPRPALQPETSRHNRWFALPPSDWLISYSPPPGVSWIDFLNRKYPEIHHRLECR